MDRAEKIDFLIIGQGLAGSALAMALLEKEKTVLVVDDLAPSAATRVAAGLITPLAGKGMNPSWRQAQYLPEALDYYRKIEGQTGTKFYYSKPILRPFDDVKQQAKFDRKYEDIADWVNPAVVIPEGVKADAGAFTMKHGGRLETCSYIEAVRQLLGDSFYQASVSEEDLAFFDDRVVWNEISFGKVIFCNGYNSFQGQFFKDIPERSAKGEMLTIRIEELAEDQIISRGGWLVPLGNKRWRAGATYQWDHLDVKPTEGGKADLLQRVEKLIDQPFEIECHNAGIRPIVNRSQPIIGMHRTIANLGIFNGLGSKGVITAPPVARHFADYLSGDAELDPELDIARLF